MQTVYDWASIILFAGIATLFLQRSMAPEPSDKVWQYAPPALGCAIANQLGNNGYPIFAWLLLAAVVGYVVMVLKPKLPNF